jgi:hypothetical protein
MTARGRSPWPLDKFAAAPADLNGRDSGASTASWQRHGLGYLSRLSLRRICIELCMLNVSWRDVINVYYGEDGLGDSKQFGAFTVPGGVSYLVKIADGGGLYLAVMPNGGRYWRFDYRFLGKRKTLPLGIGAETRSLSKNTQHLE